MIITNGSQHLCFYCREPYEEKEKARACWESHNIVYVPISTQDLNKLNHYLFSGDEKLLTQDLVRIIGNYTAKAAERSWAEE